jgi:hypothetical protein
MPETINSLFGPMLRAIFHPIHSSLSDVYMPWARICALGLFVGAMVWVYVLRKEYVNLDSPGQEWYYDLRLWTVVSMLPHVFVYLYF